MVTHGSQYFITTAKNAQLQKHVCAPSQARLRRIPSAGSLTPQNLFRPVMINDLSNSLIFCDTIFHFLFYPFFTLILPFEKRVKRASQRVSSYESSTYIRRELFCFFSAVFLQKQNSAKANSHQDKPLCLAAVTGLRRLLAFRSVGIFASLRGCRQSCRSRFRC